VSNSTDQVPPSPLSGDEAPSIDPLAPERVDAITYRLITVGFILLTLVIITGAAWAQYTWHRWWSWDPKETSALVAWLVYVVYLHGRLSGWSKRLLAWIAVIGAASVAFCYAGVNFLGGMHAYGAPTQSLLSGATHAFQGMRGTEALLAKGFLVSYLAAFVLYLGTAVFGGGADEEPEVSRARKAGLTWVGAVPMLIGFILQTVALVSRSVQAGRLPFSSGYEYAASFAWAMVLVFLVLQFRIRTPVIGAASLPFILLILAYGFLWFGDKGVSPLPVALQNKFWLHLHVAIAIVSYAALILATATSAIYLVKSRREPEPTEA
jgi:ABC-type transport system involved in cytochrome c biogenesis permease subunit